MVGAAVMAAVAAAAPRQRLLMDGGWKFNLGDSGPAVSCNASSFPEDLDNQQCMGLNLAAQ
jgi:hypothetical protein